MGKFAVIDIGSNSVRLVVYESLKRAPYVIFNEKILCGLGRGLHYGGLMQDSAMDSAIGSLKRFHLMLDKMSVKNFRVAATSAVREAQNGPEFIKRISAECHLDVAVISGEEEARLSGLGVLCALPHAHGIVGDLGGGSLELAKISDGNVMEQASFMIGPMKYQSLDGKTTSSPKKDIDEALTSLDWGAGNRSENFYAVGGSWRALAKIHIMEQGYFLNNVHHYIMSREECLELTGKLSKMHFAELTRYSAYVSSRRLKVLSLSAYILNRLVKKLDSRCVVISGYGLREGLLFEAMDHNIRSLDPMLEACHDIAEKNGRFSEHGKRIQRWIDPLFLDEDVELNRLRYAASILSDVGWRGHPEYRPKKVLYEILYGRLLGVTHRGAAFIGMALYICYGGVPGGSETASVETLLQPGDIAYANRVGLVLRLVQRISGGTEKGLKSASLTVKGSILELNVLKEDEAIINEVVLKRFSKVAQEFNLKDKVRII